jgi:DNA-binding Lrp family transcriptional regulator
MLVPAPDTRRESALGFRLLNEFQRAFPLVPAPFAVLAAQLSVREVEVLEALAALLDAGAVSRVGAVFAPNSIGVSTLAALRVPQGRLTEVAALVSARHEVNHNYEREGDPNLWFVMSAADENALEHAAHAIESAAQCGTLLRFPLIEEYRIDLGFDLRADAPTAAVSGWRAPPVRTRLDAADRALMSALQTGLALTPFPFRTLGTRIGVDEDEVLARVRRWTETGAIRRFGVVVRHRQLGYRANAMAVWDVPDEVVAGAGHALARQAGVTLCYRRERRLPDWPFNLYCMIHGRIREQVLERLSEIGRVCALDRFASRMLFSRTCYKQRGAVYFPGDADGLRGA